MSADEEKNETMGSEISVTMEDHTDIALIDIFQRRMQRVNEQICRES